MVTFGFIMLCYLYSTGCFATTEFYEFPLETGLKSLTNFPSILHDGNCTNIVFIEDLRYQESSDAITDMFLKFVSDNKCANYLTYLSIR